MKDILKFLLILGLGSAAVYITWVLKRQYDIDTLYHEGKITYEEWIKSKGVIYGGLKMPISPTDISPSASPSEAKSTIDQIAKEMGYDSCPYGWKKSTDWVGNPTCIPSLAMSIYD